jgi:gliding motility-associated lipoprotein GldH
MDELTLFNANTGKPLGSGLGDIFDHKFKIKSLSNYRFPKAGEYTFSVEQNMRQDPLLGVISVGVSIEPVYSKQ